MYNYVYLCIYVFTYVHVCIHRFIIMQFSCHDVTLVKEFGCYSYTSSFAMNINTLLEICQAGVTPSNSPLKITTILSMLEEFS